MAAINGTDVALLVDGNPVAMLTDATLNIDQDLPDSSSKDSSGWAEHINGQRSWSIDPTGRADFGDGKNVEIFYDLIANRSQVDAEINPPNTGDITFSGTVSLANMTVGTPNEDVSSLDGSLTGTGELSKSSVS